MSKIATFIKHPVISVKGKISDYKQNKISYYLKPEIFEKLSDKKAIKVRYYLNFGKYPNLKHPKTFNEKLQWLKLYNRKPEYTKLVDKYEVKKIVADIIGEEYIIPTLGVWNSADEIDFDSLPDKFVLKCTHDSASVIICKNKFEFDIDSAKEKLNSCLKKNLYIWGREWPYKDVKPRIIAEEFLQDGKEKDIKDYKFYCFNKTPKYLYVSEGLENHDTAKIEFFDMNFNPAPFGRSDFRKFVIKPGKPYNFEQMKKLAECLSKDIPFVRVDFYEVNKKIYFGELTFSPCCGLMPFEPIEYDKILGDMLKLPKKKIRN